MSITFNYAERRWKNEECTSGSRARCGACVDACENNAISKSEMKTPNQRFQPIGDPESPRTEA